jgi:uncharacterized membrane protein
MAPAQGQTAPVFYRSVTGREIDRLKIARGVHMSDTIIVATFDNTNAAYDAASAMKKLKDEKNDNFKPKAGVMVKKDDLGNMSLLETKDRPLFGTAVGTTVGALIGLIGGAPGAALGAAFGATAGIGSDAVMSGLDSDFVESVTSEMHPGITAIIVEADEKNTRPVDDIVAGSGGHVRRQAA